MSTTNISFIIPRCDKRAEFHNKFGGVVNNHHVEFTEISMDEADELQYLCYAGKYGVMNKRQDRISMQ